MTQDEIKSRLVDYFTTNFGLDENELRSDQPIFTSGLLDSLEAVNLIAFIDKELGFKLDPLSINFEQLDTVSSIASQIKPS